MRRDVDDEFVVNVVLRFRGSRRTMVSQRYPHASQELVHAERLDKVVVGSSVEQPDFRIVRVTGGDHDHRRLALCAQHAEERFAVAIRQSEIEQHEVETAFRQRLRQDRWASCSVAAVTTR